MTSPGEKLGPYEIIERIGEGGMGAVWKARDPRLNRIVAIKQIHGAHSGRFEQEARAIAALNHPNICQIHDVGPDYLVLEYIEGRPLKGPLAADQALRVAQQVAAALDAAHERGILHRDLKPANILMTKNGVKLLDFGLAKLNDDADPDTTRTVDGAVMGTAAYMSPEQAQGKPTDARSDIFSFGAVLYEVLSGKRAFGGNSMLETLNAVVRSEPSALDSPLASVVTRCMAKEAAARYQTVAELRAALQAPEHKASTQPAIPSIAVLPFANMSGDKDQEYFSDGLAEEIINALAQHPGLKVTARTSAFAFRGKEQDIRKIAEALDVQTILEGSVRRAGNRIRVMAQLINSADGYHLWSQRYDRELTDVFEVQDEIAASITQALQLKLAPQPPAGRYKPNLPAYEAYLKGKHYSYQITAESMARAREYLEQAVSLDPKFAQPCSELARMFVSLSLGGVRPTAEVMPLVEAWAQRALAIDPFLPEAQSCLGLKAVFFDYDWDGAARRFSLALSREPVPPVVWMDYALFSVGRGRPRDAEESVRAAVAADPLMVFYRVHLVLILLVTGRDLEAEQQLRQVLDIDQNSYVAWFFLGHVLLARGQPNDALASFQKAHALNPSTRTSGTLAGAFALTGDTARAQELLDKLGPATTHGVPTAWALFHLLQGEVDQAADWFEKAIDQKEVNAGYWTRTGIGAALRSSPRWPALAKRMNLPESAW
jgi:TolB-like protein/tRNA A-37 threonylcarbamoyl transferase component Bud32